MAIVRQVIGKLPAGLISSVRILSQRLANGMREARMDYRAGFERRHRRLIDDLVHHGGHVLSVKGLLPGDQLVENYAQREDVRPPVHGLTFDLFRRHVGWRAQDLTGERHAGFSGEHLGDAKISHLYHSAFQDHDVGRLDVAMDNVVAMGVVERARHLLEDRDDGLDREDAFFVQQLPKRYPVQELHGEVEDAVVFAEVMNGDDVRVGERAGRLRLALKARFVILVFAVGEAFGPHRLDGDLAIDQGIEAFVHYSHRPAPDLPGDLVPACFEHEGSASPLRGLADDLERAWLPLPAKYPRYPLATSLPR